MDAIEGLDEGVYAHFSFQAEPAILAFMKPPYYVSSYAGIGVLLALILLLFLWQGKFRSALTALISVMSATALIEIIRIVVPRARPQHAILWLGADARTGSYPSAGVFLFMLCMILLGHALWDSLRPGLRSAYVIAAVLLTAWVCLSQFFLAIHYVTDVIGGIAGAVLVSWIAAPFMSAKVKSPGPSCARSAAE